MLASIIHVARQVLARHLAKRCMAGKPRWETVQHPDRRYVILTRCKYCHSGYYSTEQK